MVNPCPSGLSVTLHNFFETNWNDPYVTGTAGVSFKPRSVRDEATGQPTNQTVACWDWEGIDAIYAEDAKLSLSEWHEYQNANWEITSLDYYTIPDGTRSKCFSATPPPAPSLSLTYLGTASPPPPPPKNMDCCDCNTIATIIADQMADQFRLFESIKDHIDLRTKEEIQISRKQLEALEIDLQPILDRLNEVEKNLWNGIG